MFDLTYWDSDRLKRKQTELTRAANGVGNAIDPRVFSKREIEVLKEAEKILNGFKEKIQHEKEKAARKERELERRRKHSAGQATILLRQRVELLSLAEKVQLVVKANASWNFANYLDAHKALDSRGLEWFEKCLRTDLDRWINDTSGTMGMRAHSDFQPIVVNADSAREEIQYYFQNGLMRDAEDVAVKVEEQRLVENSDNVEKVQFGERHG